nr:PREDICTED: uncharacterized protein LOC109043123 [Bemisia tabaci]
MKLYRMQGHRGQPDSTPICRCRVLYLGSAVPHETKDGLQGIQGPLKELYPEQGAIGARGIDSWLSVWSNGLLLENVDENHRKVTRFFQIETLHYCAAVRYVLVPEKNSVSSSSQPRFLPLDSPFARSPNLNHPPLFAAILRRTTGIKVLECHTFICKREMAANALVRCCFHAYADSSYIRQIDGNTNSVYGTLQRQAASNGNGNGVADKVDGWQRMASPPNNTGSTLTLNSTLQNAGNTNGTMDLSHEENSADEISIYNGDENHKVWAGSTRDGSADREGIYGEYGGSTMRSSRSSRPRQIENAPVPPPPPIKEDKNKKTKDRSRRKKMTGGSREEMHLMNGSLARPGTSHGHGPGVNGMRSSSSVGGTLMRHPLPPNIYSNGTMLRPASSQLNGFHPATPQPIMFVPTSTLPHSKKIMANTFSHRPTKNGPVMMQRPHLPPNFIPMPPHPIYVPAAPGRKMSKHHPVPPPLTMEEPIYMPSTRPMSPVASYQPGHFPLEAYLMQHYATMDVKANKKKSKESKNKKGVPLVPLPVPMNGMPHPPHPPPPPMRADEEEDMDEESPYDTGIYRRKGHLNERAFSYSIRQEHRSRSYGSLANLKFAATPIVPDGAISADSTDANVNKTDIKKEREIMQMMHDLELSGDELERSEVPASMYQPNRQRAGKIRR